MPVTQSNPEPHIRLRTDRRDGGWSEIVVYVDAVIEGAYPILVAVVSHKRSGGKWVLHPSDAPAVRFTTRKEALKCALWWARRSDAYKIHIEREAR